MSGQGHSEFDTKTEVVAVWLLFLIVGCLIYAMYYLTLVRIPPAPILEKFFASVTVPPAVQNGLTKAWSFMKSKSSAYAKKLNALNKEIEMKPLTAASASETARSTSEDMAAAIIGVPLEDDEDGKENLSSNDPSETYSRNQGKEQASGVTLVDL